MNIESINKPKDTGIFIKTLFLNQSLTEMCSIHTEFCDDNKLVMSSVCNREEKQQT